MTTPTYGCDGCDRTDVDVTHQYEDADRTVIALSLCDRCCAEADEHYRQTEADGLDEMRLAMLADDEADAMAAMAEGSPYEGTA